MVRIMLLFLAGLAATSGCGEPKVSHRAERTRIETANPELGRAATTKPPRAIATH